MNSGERSNLRRGLLAASAALLLLAAIPSRTQPASHPAPPLLLHDTRHSPSDLELGGDLPGVPHGHTRFVSYAQLLALPQESYTVVDDPNFGRPVRISGVPLAALSQRLGVAPAGNMVIAICDDAYAAHYPAEYLHEHHPLLVLRVNGQPPAHWPLGVDRVPMGPYMVAHPSFHPAWQVLAHKDEAQVPWGVVRLDLRREADVYAPITPHGDDPLVQQGFRIARQNCFRCHSRDGEGGTKSNRDWSVVARRAATDSQFFDAYVRNPKALNPSSQMAASPAYDAATLRALRAYFTTFQ